MDSEARFLSEMWQSVTSNAVVTGLLVGLVMLSLIATAACLIVTLRYHGALRAIGRTVGYALLDAVLIGAVALGVGTPVGRLPMSLPGQGTFWLFLPAPAAYDLMAIAAHVLLSLAGSVALVYVWTHAQTEVGVDRGGIATVAGGILVVIGWEASGWPIYLTVGVEALTLLGVAYEIRAILPDVGVRLFRRDNAIPRRRLMRVATVVSYLILSLGSFAIILFHSIGLYLVNFIGIYVGLTLLDDVAAYLGSIRLPFESPPRELTPKRWYVTCPLVLVIMSLGATGIFNAILVNTALDARVWLEAGGAAFAFIFFAPLTDSARYSTGVRDLREQYGERHVAPTVTPDADIQNADSGEGSSNGGEEQTSDLFNKVVQSLIPILASADTSRREISQRDFSEKPLTERLKFPGLVFFLATGLLYHALISNPSVTNLLGSGFVPVVFVVTAAVTGVVPLLNNPRLEPVREVFIFLVFVISVLAGTTLLLTTALTPAQLRSVLQAHDVGQLFSGQSLSAILYNTSLLTLVLLTVGQLAYLFLLINTVIAVEQEHKLASDLEELGRDFAEEGNYVRAGLMYKRAYDADPASFAAVWNIGYLFHLRAAYKNALISYDRALRLTDDDGFRATVLHNRAEVYQEQGLYQRALKACAQSRKLAPGWVWPLITSGRVHTAMGNFEEAESVLSRADYDYPYIASIEWENIRTSWGDLYRVMGRYDDAISECRYAEETGPTSPGPVNSLGWVYISQGSYETALETFRRGLKKCKTPMDKSSFNYAIGETYFRQGSLTEALANYELASAQNPYDVTTLNLIATVKRRQGEFKEALNRYGDIVEKFPDDPWARIGLIACLRTLERTPEKQEQIDEAQRTPEKQEQQEQIDEARRLIRSEDDYTRACLESVCGETDKAFEFLRSAVEKKQRQPLEVRIDEDLSFIRNDPRFEQILGEYSAA